LSGDKSGPIGLDGGRERRGGLENRRIANQISI
jgi:hypothetical protein